MDMNLENDERSDPRTRVLDVAELLFMERGYTAISLRDIADTLGIKQASLYYHFPQGKEELYVAVVQRAFARHGEGVRKALAEQGSLRERLRAIARWFAGQPRLCLMGMIHADLPALQAEHAQVLQETAFSELFQPLSQEFAQARVRGEIRHEQPHLLAGAFLALLDGLTIGQFMRGTPPRATMADQLIDLMLFGASGPVPVAGAAG